METFKIFANIRSSNGLYLAQEMEKLEAKYYWWKE